MEFPMEEITAAIIAVISYVLGLFTKKTKNQ
jgi:hypothetical protein